jgi:hypothetical protein
MPQVVQRFARAFIAGLVGAGVMSALTAVGRRRRIHIDFESMLGTILGGPPRPAQRRAGFAIQLLNGGLLAQPYAAALDRVPGVPGWAVGIALGLVHSLVAGAALGVAPAVHPEIPGRLPEPGPFYARQGQSAIALFVVAHAVYGAIVGTLCARRQRSDAAR